MQKQEGYTREDMLIDKNHVQSGDFVDVRCCANMRAGKVDCRNLVEPPCAVTQRATSLLMVKPMNVAIPQPTRVDSFIVLYVLKCATKQCYVYMYLLFVKLIEKTKEQRKKQKFLRSLPNEKTNEPQRNHVSCITCITCIHSGSFKFFLVKFPHGIPGYRSAQSRWTKKSWPSADFNLMCSF